MEKRIFLAVVISIAVLFSWAAIAPKLFPELAPKPPIEKSKQPATTTTSAPAVSPAAEPTAPAVSTAAPTIPAVTQPTVAAAPAVTTVAATVEKPVTIDTPIYTAVLSNRGAQLRSFRLKHHRDKGKEVDLIRPRQAQMLNFPFAIEPKTPALMYQFNQSLYEVTERTEKGARVIEMRHAANGVSVTKTFRFTAEYQFDFHVAVEPPMPYRIVVGPGIRNLTPDADAASANLSGNGVFQREGDFELIHREKASRLEAHGQVEFIGIEDGYFLAALKPTRSGDALLRRIDFPIPGEAKKKDRQLYAGVNAGADGVISGTAFFGPKQTNLLERYGLESALQFGMFGIIARAFLEALVWINNYTLNFGFAIIVLTILIKIALYPLQHKSIVSMRRMQKVQPKMEAIKNKYKKAKSDPDQRQKMNTEMMKLYQQEGINPMAGCFPILLQLPILWGFYGLLSRAIELRGAPWILWIKDLSEKDPTYVLPILMTVTMFIQTWITPTTADPQQRRIFLIMPLVFGFFFKDFPSGLVLYWLVQNVLTIIQQLIMNKWWKDHPKDDDDEKK